MSCRRLAGAVALCAAACSADDPFEIPPVTWSGEHLDYAPQAHAEPLCTGTLPYMDRTMTLAAAAMDLEIGRSVYVHGSDEDPALCPAVGCVYDDRIVYSELAPHEHELIHAVRAFGGHPLKFFEEGAAEMFGGDDHDAHEIEPATGDLREGFSAGPPGVPLPIAWYPRAGHFSAYLHENHGPSVTEALLRETTEASTVAATIDVLEEATGMPFEKLVADYEGADSFCDEHWRYRYPLFPCDAPEALRPRCDGEVAIPIEESMACEDPLVLGPRQGEVFKYVAFEVPADGEYRFHRARRLGGEAARIDIKACHMGCRSIYASLPYNEASEYPAEQVFLRAGRYALRLTRPAESDEPASMAITISGDDCW